VLAVIKRYSMALVFLLLVVFLMILGTMGVTMFEEQLIKDAGGQQLKPRGEEIKL